MVEDLIHCDLGRDRCQMLSGWWVTCFEHKGNHTGTGEQNLYSLFMAMEYAPFTDVFHWLCWDDKNDSKLKVKSFTA